MQDVCARLKLASSQNPGKTLQPPSRSLPSKMKIIPTRLQMRTACERLKSGRPSKVEKILPRQSQTRPSKTTTVSSDSDHRYSCRHFIHPWFHFSSFLTSFILLYHSPYYLSLSHDIQTLIMWPIPINFELRRKDSLPKVAKTLQPRSLTFESSSRKRRKSPNNNTTILFYFPIPQSLLPIIKILKEKHRAHFARWSAGLKHRFTPSAARSCWHRTWKIQSTCSSQCPLNNKHYWYCFK